MILTKILGGLSLLAGIFFIFVFPDISEYQYGPISAGGILIGLILLAVGVYLILS